MNTLKITLYKKAWAKGSKSTTYLGFTMNDDGSSDKPVLIHIRKTDPNYATFANAVANGATVKMADDCKALRWSTGPSAKTPLDIAAERFVAQNGSHVLLKGRQAKSNFAFEVEDIAPEENEIEADVEPTDSISEFFPEENVA